ncbi:MAG: phytoene synthase [Paraglaciecola sp.]|jgi:phytoene synthase
MNDDPTELLKKHGKTFNFARLFLGSKTGLAAARLYRFCRIVDDIADESPDPEIAKVKLNDLKASIAQNTADHPVVKDFLRLCEEYTIERHHGITLIDGVSQDLNIVALPSLEALIQYAYKVAGVVGLMMAPILGAKKVGYAFAIDLGIGMQLTNIARDVLEDAQMGRRYLPGEWVNGLSTSQIALANVEHTEQVQEAIKVLLSLAEKYYQSGLAGLYYLPPRNRQAIAVAAYVYRDIGRKLLKNDCHYWLGRVVVSKPKKILLASQALWHLNTAAIAHHGTDHQNELHSHLQCDILNK